MTNFADFLIKAVLWSFGVIFFIMYAMTINVSYRYLTAEQSAKTYQCEKE